MNNIAYQIITPFNQAGLWFTQQIRSFLGYLWQNDQTYWILIGVIIVTLIASVFSAKYNKVLFYDSIFDFAMSAWVVTPFFYSLIVATTKSHFLMNTTLIVMMVCFIYTVIKSIYDNGFLKGIPVGFAKLVIGNVLPLALLCGLIKMFDRNQQRPEQMSGEYIVKEFGRFLVGAFLTLSVFHLMSFLINGKRYRLDHPVTLKPIEVKISNQKILEVKKPKAVLTDVTLEDIEKEIEAIKRVNRNTKTIPTLAFVEVLSYMIDEQMDKKGIEGEKAILYKEILINLYKKQHNLC